MKIFIFVLTFIWRKENMRLHSFRIKLLTEKKYIYVVGLVHEWMRIWSVYVSLEKILYVSAPDPFQIWYGFCKNSSFFPKKTTKFWKKRVTTEFQDHVKIQSKIFKDPDMFIIVFQIRMEPENRQILKEVCSHGIIGSCQNLNNSKLEKKDSWSRLSGIHQVLSKILSDF